MTRIELVRSGGVTGLSLRSTVDTGAAEDPDAAWFADALAGLDWPGLLAQVGSAAPGAPGGAPDRFRYRLALEDATGRQEVTFGETEVPEPLRPVVDRLVTRARTGTAAAEPPD